MNNVIEFPQRHTGHEDWRTDWRSDVIWDVLLNILDANDLDRVRAIAAEALSVVFDGDAA